MDRFYIAALQRRRQRPRCAGIGGQGRKGAAGVLSRGQRLSPPHGATSRKPVELQAIRGVRPLLSQGVEGAVPMFSRPLAFLVALGCVTAAAGGAYVATRHNAAEQVATTASVPASAVSTPPAATPASQPAPQAVAETETAVTGPRSAPPAVQKSAKSEPAPSVAARRPDPVPQKPAAQTPKSARNEPTVARTVPMNGAGAAAYEPQAAPPQ